ncbi:hypothetical protein AN7940.2 [Aspergillus nidulans FGSC A4]|uniref:Uncharacterized protein n=1 Tax=Emericella nidulans (strain FGSC A4 / ATCC 38163 / CBS 112.46 / NRRL 194 / M139) TaxID=227321 RepID=Q5AUU0_EMENI|nr:hypothetical protein [Aspergillus nidulans FGSC A4]EAA59594.1 hypothetical protein AN7940.2 [Aspergillus nidulans FGSC A4]CBF73564.1 TPA: conserved hypothetical protein [Aspergillus nidulans FGSC A4]|eukprot:XP_681209.1 hypothetical protein AN7940.2 [Aspergillus nidulans FGSC A4]
MADMNEPGVTRQFLSWVSSLTAHDIPEKIQKRVKYLTLDELGCAMVAAHLPWTEKATGIILDMEAEGSCPRVGPLPAALLNSMQIQGFEIDDWHSLAPVHSNAIVLPALFAGAANAKAKGTVTLGDSLLLSAIPYALTGLALGRRIRPRTGCGGCGKIDQPLRTSNLGCDWDSLHTGLWSYVCPVQQRYKAHAARIRGTKWSLCGSARSGGLPGIKNEYPDKMKDLSKIKKITFEMSESAYKHGGWPAQRPLTVTGAQMSCAYAAPVQLIDGQAEETGNAMSQRARVKFNDGTEVSKFVAAAKGFDLPLSNREIVDKFRTFTKGLIPEEMQRKIEETVLGLEGIEDISELEDLLAGLISSPFMGVSKRSSLYGG